MRANVYVLSFVALALAPIGCGGGSDSADLGSCTNPHDGVCVQYFEDRENTATGTDTEAQCLSEGGIYGSSCTPVAELPTCNATLSVNGGKRVKSTVYWSESFCERHDPDLVCAQYDGSPVGDCPSKGSEGGGGESQGGACVQFLSQDGVTGFAKCSNVKTAYDCPPYRTGSNGTYYPSTSCSQVRCKGSTLPAKPTCEVR